MFYHNQWLDLLSLIGFCALTGYYAYIVGKVHGYSSGLDDAHNEKDDFGKQDDSTKPTNKVKSPSKPIVPRKLDPAARAMQQALARGWKNRTTK